MCGICGCDEHKHEHHHDHSHNHANQITIEESIFEKNNQFAMQNAMFLDKHSIVAINIMSSPGSGKTTLLMKTIEKLNNSVSISVLTGDQATHEDAQKIRSIGGDALQINTGRVCHLDAHMIGHALEEINLKKNSVLFIENIGNLVCPAFFRLGEKYKVVVLSVTEGDNKPIKYPEMFLQANLLLITKIDLLPYVDFNTEKCMEYARQINPDIEIIMLSSKSEEGFNQWCDWLKEKCHATH